MAGEVMDKHEFKPGMQGWCRVKVDPPSVVACGKAESDEIHSVTKTPTTDSSVGADLLPCPFCGEVPSGLNRTAYDNPRFYSVVCNGCCSIASGETPRLVIQRWNTRAATQPVGEQNGSMTTEQMERAQLIAESRGIDLETASELVYLRDIHSQPKVGEQWQREWPKVNGWYWMRGFRQYRMLPVEIDGGQLSMMYGGHYLRDDLTPDVEFLSIALPLPPTQPNSGNESESEGEGE